MYVVCSCIHVYVAIASYVMHVFNVYIYIVNDTPLLEELCQYITPQYATEWEVIGILLGVPAGTLDIIEYDNSRRTTDCCNAMLKKWLEIDDTASWNKLLTAIESPVVSCSDKGDYSYCH